MFFIYKNGAVEVEGVMTVVSGEYKNVAVKVVSVVTPVCGVHKNVVVKVVALVLLFVVNIRMW